MNTAEDTLQDMVKRSQAGDLTAFQQLLEHFQDYVFILAVRLLGDREEARDAVQETFIRAWKHINRYHSGSKLTTWLYRIVTNLCLDRLKARQRKYRVFARDYDYNHGDLLETAADHGDFNPEEASIKNDLVERIIRFSQELPPKQRVVFVLRDLQEANMKEVEQITGMSCRSIKSNLFHARRTIREKLQAPCPGSSQKNAAGESSIEEVKK